MFLQRIVLVSAFMVGARASLASEGYLAVHGTYGQFLGQPNTHKSSGGWLMGGEDSWRIGAGGYGLFSDLSIGAHDAINLWYAGPILYWVPNPRSRIVVVHLGAQVGAGFAESSQSSRAKFFWNFEPSMLLAYRLSAWAGIGITASYSYMTDFKSDSNIVDTLQSSFNVGAMLIVGEF